ncbi:MULTISPECIES: hypothetical protein [unclassified Pseudomonas]|uniref:hypothetical protein n=1 Tax=unclassified Pseudomonas TaxID=196821 RepID=UPI002097673B|nr:MULTISPECIES: hypothetical protein [unclassified Pseudomonas]MCO7518766.1 hypothetical protein [Pseudomonas sp. 1]MCO7540799.1 hypothetical protein [Pseudomonas sp. VA159-2]
MANTQVFTLGLGISADQPLGATFDTLRQRIGRLRKEADGTRLGRLIGEVLRLGLELDKVGHVGRELADKQAGGHEAQVERLRDEGARVVQLQQAYGQLGRAIAGLPLLRPVEARPPPLRLSAAHGKAPAEVAAKPPTPASPTATPRSAGEKTRIVMAGLGGLTAGGIAAYKASRRLSPEERQRAVKAVRGKVRMGAATAALKTGEALVTGEDGRAKAKGVGAAVGELAGNLLGAALGAAKGGARGSQRGEDYASLFGGYLGEKLGGRAGEGLYDFFTDSSDDKGRTPAASSASAQAGAAAPASSLQLAGPQVDLFEAQVDAGALPALGSALGELELGASRAGQRLLALGAPAPAATAPVQTPASTVLQALADKPKADPSAAPGTAPVASSDAPKGVFAKMGGAVKSLGKPAVLGAVGKGLETFTSDKSDSDKAEGYGSAVGGLVGTLVGGALGSVVPGLGTVVGSTVGGMLGEAVGGWVGKTWFGGDQQAAPAAKPASASKIDTASGPAKEGAQPAQAPAAATSAVEPRGVGAAMKVLAKPAVLKATQQGLTTFTSDKPAGEKAEGYGSAVGGLVGTLVGGAIGSVVPVLGTTFGAALGGMVGDQLGGWLGKTWFAGKEQPAQVGTAAKAGVATPAQAKAEPGDVLRSISSPAPTAPAAPAGISTPPATPPAPVYNQQFTFTSNMPVTVSNSLDDPGTLAQLEAIARRQLEELMRQARSVQLADTPHIAL